MNEHKKEKRHFSRVPFDCEAVITSAGKDFKTHLFDICLNGALLKRPDDWLPDIGSTCELTLTLPDGALFIRLQQSTVAHSHSDRVGLQCNVIDIDSITQLRRLVELNLGDPELVNRELTQLGQGSGQML